MQAVEEGEGVVKEVGADLGGGGGVSLRLGQTGWKTTCSTPRNLTAASEDGQGGSGRDAECRIGGWVDVGNEGSISTNRKRTAHVNSVSRLTAGRGADNVVGDSIFSLNRSYLRDICVVCG